MVRKVAALLFSKLTGVVESPSPWQVDAFGREEGQLMDEVIGEVDVILSRCFDRSATGDGHDGCRGAHSDRQPPCVGHGIGYVDAHLLAATMLRAGSHLWTRDKRLAAVAAEQGLASTS